MSNVELFEEDNEFIHIDSDDIQELEKLNQQYIEFIDEVAIVSRADKKGNITYVNDMFCKVSGYNKLELLGKNHNILRHPNNSKEFFKNLWDTISSGKKWKGVIRNQTKDGVDYYENSTIFPIFHNKKIVEYVSIRFIVTDEELTKNRLKKYIRHQKYEKIQSQKELDSIVEEKTQDVIAEEVKKREKLQELLYEMDKELNEMRQKKDQTTKINILKDEEIVSLKKQLDKERTQNKTTLLTVKRERIELLQKVNKTEKNYKILSEKLDRAQGSITVLQGYIDDYRKKIDDLNEVIKDNEREMEKLKKK
jgi:PAS domain S-box-containing protein